jgi:hypothetical protein
MDNPPLREHSRIATNIFASRRWGLTITSRLCIARKWKRVYSSKLEETISVILRPCLAGVI